MAEERKLIEWKPLGESYPGAEALRALRRNGHNLLVVSRTASTPPLGAETSFAALDAANPRSGWKTIASIRQVVPAQPAWDVSAETGGDFQILYEKIGGAINALVLRASSGDTRVLTGEYSMQSFSLPRFAKASAAWVTAVVDNRMCVALPLAQAGPYHELGECADGLLIQDGPGFAFLFKKTIPGTVRGNNVTPGRLQVVALDPDLHPSGEPVEVVAGTIYQFDAFVTGNRLVVGATTPDGVVVAAGVPAGRRFTRKEYAASRTLTSPVVLSGPARKLVVYALESEGEAHILAAEVPVP